MTNPFINLLKWFASQNLMAKFSIGLFLLASGTAGTTWLLIQNYKDQRIEDKETIKNQALQLEVVRAVCAANERRKDSIQQIEINNERLKNKIYWDAMRQDQEKLENQYRETIAGLKDKK